MHLASASFRGLVTIQMLIRLRNSKLHILCGKESQQTNETRQAETKDKQKHKSLRQLASRAAAGGYLGISATMQVMRTTQEWMGVEMVFSITQ